jgi:hypothetical protein
LLLSAAVAVAPRNSVESFPSSLSLSAAVALAPRKSVESFPVRRLLRLSEERKISAALAVHVESGLSRRAQLTGVSVDHPPGA